MEFKDYYATLGIEPTATHDDIKRAYRKLARKYHPDVSKEVDAEARFKEVAEAYKALIDPEKRAAYDDIGKRHQRGEPFEPPPGWDSGFEYSGRGDGAQPHAGDPDFSEFFESLFGRARAHERRGRHATSDDPMQGSDHHAKIVIDLMDTYQGAQRTISLRMPVFDAQGHVSLTDRQLNVSIPKGVRQGQHLRLVGQGASGHNGASAGDLYLEIQFRPHAIFRVDERDVYIDLPVTPTEAALGATITVPTPSGKVQLNIPAGSAQGRKLRLKGRGLPCQPPGDLYAVLTIALAPPDTAEAKAAYNAFAQAFPHYNPRTALEV